MIALQPLALARRLRGACRIVTALSILLLLSFGQALAQTAELEPLVVETASGQHGFMVELADSDEARGRGLMYRETLPADEGMLFDFQRSQEVYFWMKNTYVSLDMIFIREDGTVAAIAENTQPLSERVIPSGAPVRFVLEVVAGTARRIGLSLGDRVTHQRIGGG